MKGSSCSEGVKTVPACRGSENFLRLIGELLGRKTPSPGVSSFVASRWWVLIDVGVFILSEAAQSFFFSFKTILFYIAIPVSSLSNLPLPPTSVHPTHYPVLRESEASHAESAKSLEAGPRPSPCI